jgi:hypothetical protein
MRGTGSCYKNMLKPKKYLSNFTVAESEVENAIVVLPLWAAF